MGAKAAAKWRNRFGDDWRRKRGVLKAARRFAATAPTTKTYGPVATSFGSWEGSLTIDPRGAAVRCKRRLRDEWRELQRQEGVALKAATRGLLDALRLRPDVPRAD